MSKNHGHKVGGRETKHYARWRNMMRRCHYPSHRLYPLYGARGIKVCARWRKFANFLADMGECPEGYSLERIDNDGDYSPENCRWATPAEQSRNTRRTINVNVGGRELNLKDACALLGLNYNTVHSRIMSGCDPASALTKPKFKHARSLKAAA